MGDREGMWQTADNKTVIWQPSVRRFIIMEDGKTLDTTTSEERARNWIAGGYDK